MTSRTLILFLAGVFALGFAVPVSAQDNSLTEIRKFLDELNKSLPVEVDEDTVLERIDAAYGEIVYYYTIKDYTYEEIEWAEIRDNVLAGATNYYCTTPELSVFRDKGLGLLYIYSDKNGALTATLKIPADSCDEAEG